MADFNPNYVPAVMSIFGGLLGYGSASENRRLAREQRIQAEQNSLLEARELREQVRRQAEQNLRLRSSALARAAASGAKIITGSVAFYLDYMETEQDRQLDWLKTAGASRIRINLNAGIAQADATRIRAESQMYSSIITGVTGAFKFADEAGLFTNQRQMTFGSSNSGTTPMTDYRVTE